MRYQLALGHGYGIAMDQVNVIRSAVNVSGDNTRRTRVSDG